MHTPSSHLHYSGTDASWTRSHVSRALYVLLTALAFVAGATIGQVNAGPAPSPTPTEAPSVPGGTKPDKLLPLFVEGGYSGYMSSEWEGHMYSRGSGIEAVQKHHALSKRILAPYN